MQSGSHNALLAKLVSIFGRDSRKKYEFFSEKALIARIQGYFGRNSQQTAV
jgi:hypothetical protein